MFELKDKIVVITGAAGGLGRAFAQAFVAQGAKVVVCDKNYAGAQETAQMLGGMALEVDVTREHSVEKMANEVLATFGKIDILVNNAAIYASIQRKPFYELTEAEWDLVLDVNLKGVWLVSKAVCRSMRANNYGKIINISSATVMSGSPNWSHYVASKGASSA